MDRRQFLAGSLLSMSGAGEAGQTAHSPFSAGAAELPSRSGFSLPEFDGAAAWINADPLRKRSLRGKVVLVNFWTYSCINSLRPLPYLKKWAAQFKNDGLVVVGVHTPEFSFEKQRANVDWAVREFHIDYPVAMDNDHRIWRAFQNEAWPAFYLADGNGNVRSRRLGEGQYDDHERAIGLLLKEIGGGAKAKDAISLVADGIEAAPGVDVRTPETYVGYRGAERFNSPERVARDSRKTYTVPATLRLNQWGLSGAWEIASECGVLREPRGTIALRFHSRDLHLVLGPAENGKPVRFQVTLDGSAPGIDAGVNVSKDGNGEVRESRLYQLVRQKSQTRDRLFTIEFPDSGVRAYSFTFG